MTDEDITYRIGSSKIESHRKLRRSNERGFFSEAEATNVTTSKRETWDNCHYPSKKIAILCTKTTKHIINTALALSDSRHEVVIITLDNNAGTIRELGKKDISLVKGTILPSSICSLFKSSLSYIRTVYVAIRTVIYPPVIKPSIIFCDTNNVALPILHLRYGVIKIHSYNNILKPPRPSRLENIFLRYADEILVPNRLVWNLQRGYYSKLKVKPFACYPLVNTGVFSDNVCIPIKTFLPELIDDGILFCAIGDYTEDSNLEVILEAFNLLRHMIPGTQMIRLHLVVISSCEFGPEQHAYYRKLQKYSEKMYFSSHAWLFKNLPDEMRKSIMCKSLAILYGGCQEPYNKHIMEAMWLGKPIIACNYGFAKEVLQDRITGFLLSIDPRQFSEAMYNLLRRPALLNSLSVSVNLEFHKKYNIEQYTSIINKVVHKASNIEKEKLEEKIKQQQRQHGFVDYDLLSKFKIRGTKSTNPDEFKDFPILDDERTDYESTEILDDYEPLTIVELPSNYTEVDNIDEN